MSSIWQKLAHVLTYPQSVVTGLTGYHPGMLGDTSRSVGNTDLLKQALNFNQQVSPSQLGAFNQPEIANTLGSKIAGTTANLAYDPLLALGGPGGILSKLAEGTKLEAAAKGVNTFGKLGEDASKAAKAGQVGRRLYQGAVSTGSLQGAIPAAFAIGLGENAATKYLPGIATKFLAKGLNPNGVAVAEQAVGNVEAPTVLDKVLELTKAQQPFGELMPAKPVPNVSVPIVPSLPVASTPQPNFLSGADLRAQDNPLNVLIAALQDPKTRIQMMQKLQGKQPLVFPGG